MLTAMLVQCGHKNKRRPASNNIDLSWTDTDSGYLCRFTLLSCASQSTVYRYHFAVSEFCKTSNSLQLRGQKWVVGYLRVWENINVSCISYMQQHTKTRTFWLFEKLWFWVFWTSLQAEISLTYITNLCCDMFLMIMYQKNVKFCSIFLLRLPLYFDKVNCFPLWAGKMLYQCS